MDELARSPGQFDEIVSVLREIKELQEAGFKRLTEIFHLERQATMRESNRLLRSLLRDAKYGDPKRLEHFGYKVFSEGGEDGIIQEIFRRIGTTNKRFVEFGVSDGNQCNTHFLLYLGWSGLWIEIVPQRAAAIRRIFAKAIDTGVLTVRNDKATPSTINEIIGGANFRDEIDLLSVDIDNQDYHVCRAIDVITPRVIVIECNPTFPPPAEWVVPFEPDGKREGFARGASVASMTRMLSEKGYDLVGTEIGGINAFYVRKDLVQDRFNQVGDVAALYNPPRRGFGNLAYPRGHEPPAFWSPAVAPPTTW